MYAKSLTEGYNINGIEIRSDSLRGYLTAVNHMYKSRGFDIPVDWDDKSNISVKFCDAIREWEKEPTRRTHMTPALLAELIKQADASSKPDSFPKVILDWAVLSRYTGF